MVDDLKEIKRLKKKARNYSIAEGIFASVKNSFGHHYVQPFAIAINMSSPLVAMLSSVHGLLGPLSQMFGSRLPEKYPRKKILLKTILIEAFMWLPFIALAVLFAKGILLETLPLLVLIFFGFYTIAGSLGHPAWFSWMGDIVEEKQRGKWFSKRNFIVGFVSVVLVIFAAFFLDYFKSQNMTMEGFGILFFFAFLGRLAGRKILRKQYEPKIKLKKGYYFSFWDFIINSPKNNFGKLSLFRFSFTFAATIANALLAVYLLRTLNLSYTNYMIVLFAGTTISLFFIGLWGRFADKYGNYKALCIATTLLPFIPILWIINSKILYLTLVPSAISGIAWAGIHLAESNFIYDNVTSQKRGLAISYYNMLWGIGMFLGAITSAVLIKTLNGNVLKPIAIIFIISAIARMISVIWWLPKIKEIRKTKKFKTKDAFKDILLKRATPTIHEEINQIAHIKKYLNLK